MRHGGLAFYFVELLKVHALLSSTFDPREGSIDLVHDAILSGSATCRDVVESFLSRIDALNPRVNAILSLNPNALSAADDLDETLRNGNANGPLFCVPVLLKDNFDTQDLPTTGGNLALALSQPSEDAATVRALKAAGAIILGKTNLHDMALEGLSVSSLGGQTLNPYDGTRTPGGSSGGSAAAIASSFAVFATGSDTVNSLRNPASANSLFSVRPTRGLISRAGVIPVSFTQDTVGPITRTVRDAAIALTVMASIGYDLEDNATAAAPSGLRNQDYTKTLTAGSLRGLRFGVLEGFFNRTISLENNPVNNAVDEMLSQLDSAGAVTTPIHDAIYNATRILSELDVQRYEYREALDTYLSRPSLGGSHPSSFSDLYSNSRFLVIPAQYEYINTAMFSSTSNETYATTKAGIAQLTFHLARTFSKENLDFIIYPQQKNLVVTLGSPSQSGRNGIMAAVTGSPVVTVPIGFSEPTDDAPVGVPIGMEILGRPWSEEKLLQVSWQIEQRFPVRRPPKMEVAIEPKCFDIIPTIRPNKINIPVQYPLGVR